MDVYEIRGGRQELLFSGLTQAEVNDIKEWFAYTKPPGSDLKIVVRKASGVVDGLVCAGAEAESSCQDRQPCFAG